MSRKFQRLVWVLVLSCVSVSRKQFFASYESEHDASSVARQRHVAPALTDFDEVVIVPARSVLWVDSVAYDVALECKWALEDDQMFRGEVQSLIEHMKIGLREAAKNPRAVHIFSGGRLTREAGAANASRVLKYLVLQRAE